MFTYIVTFTNGSKMRQRATSPRHAWALGALINEVYSIQWVRR